MRRSNDLKHSLDAVFDAALESFYHALQLRALDAFLHQRNHLADPLVGAAQAKRNL